MLAHTELHWCFSRSSRLGRFFLHWPKWTNVLGSLAAKNTNPLWMNKGEPSSRIWGWILGSLELTPRNQLLYLYQPAPCRLVMAPRGNIQQTRPMEGREQQTTKTPAVSKSEFLDTLYQPLRRNRELPFCLGAEDCHSRVETLKFSVRVKWDLIVDLLPERMMK